MARAPRVLVAVLLGITVVIASSMWAKPVWAQAGLRQSLERLDVNQDGEIDPDEITSLARPYLERIARERRMSLDRSNSIEELQEAARVYAALKNGVSGRNVRAEWEETVKPFGPGQDQSFVPEFGLPVVKYPYTQEDLDEADRTLRRYDRNRDGYVSREEAAVSRWTHRNPFEMDLNQDNRLDRLELTQRYARRRLLEGTAKQLNKDAWKVSRDSRRASDERDRRREDSRWRAEGGTKYYLTASVLGRFDRNRNGRLELEEAQGLGVPIGRIDVDRNGELSREELLAYLSEAQDAVGDLTAGLPGWFYELDENRDGQIQLSEFAGVVTREKLEEFSSIDTNQDGLLTSLEVAQSTALVGGSYRSEEAEVLPPHKTIISEIIVEEDYPIADLNVQISVTHTNASALDAYLTGPDGVRVELFTEVGGRDDNFDQTVFDDQADAPITKGRPPFRGSFRPEAVDKRQASLSQFNGKSVSGVWQLVIRGTRSERFGMLHGWGLLVKPQDDVLPTQSLEPVEGTGVQEEAAEADESSSAG